MNDASNSQGTSNTGTTIVAFALGAVVGAGLALLLAPESGQKTRERLASTAKRWSKDAGDAIQQARGTVAGLGEDAKSALRAGQDAFAQDRVTREARNERWANAGGAAPVNSEGHVAEESVR